MDNMNKVLFACGLDRGTVFFEERFNNHAAFVDIVDFQKSVRVSIILFQDNRKSDMVSHRTMHICNFYYFRFFFWNNRKGREKRKEKRMRREVFRTGYHTRFANR